MRSELRSRSFTWASRRRDW